MSIEASIEAGDRVIAILGLLSEKNAARAVRAASKRAATAARTAGTKRLRQIYTMRSSDVKSRTQMVNESDGTTILIRGMQERATKYRVKKRPAGIFVSVKRGSGAIAARSFEQGGAFIARRGKERYPLKSLYGPSVPQLFNNSEVLADMEERGTEVLNSRLEHEIERLLGGAR